MDKQKIQDTPAILSYSKVTASYLQVIKAGMARFSDNGR
jgi:hypothetical protein